MNRGARLLDVWWPAPVAAKVPEVIVVFWLVKLLTTGGGEATSDFLAHFGNLVGGGTELVVLLVGVVLQLRVRRYRAFAYWFFAYAIAIFGTGVADFLHLDVGLSYADTSLLWALLLGAVFWMWFRAEGTLSIHSVTTRRREVFYWATVFATFALGTALGDYTAIALHLGYLASVVVFGVVMGVPVVARWGFGVNAVAAFWAAYVITRPLGASVADYLSKPRRASGLGFGDGPSTALFAAAVLALVVYLSWTRSDVQRPELELAAPATAPPPV
ncbi:MAG: hypothetical protein ABI181_12995 [Mycobacteriaceae bacterium]